MAKGNGRPDMSSEEVYRLYREKLVPALAAALAIDDKFPAEVLNEIRAAMTHLAAASAAKNDKDKAAYELNAAYRHVRRSCVDCLKVCVQVLSSKSETAIDALTSDIQLPAHVYQRMSELRQHRKTLSAKEGERSSEDAVEDYEQLANEYDAFYKSLDEQFAGDTAEMRKAARETKEQELRTSSRAEGRKDGLFIGLITGAITGFITSILATWLIFYMGWFQR